MKYCQHCGAEIHDEAVICVHCGRNVEEKQQKKGDDSLLTVAKVFMIISCVAFPAIGLLYGFIFIMLSFAETTLIFAGIGIMLGCCLPLAWLLPMTLSLNRKIKEHEPISIAFKICTLFFANQIAGILLLCHSEDY